MNGKALMLIRAAIASVSVAVVAALGIPAQAAPGQRHHMRLAEPPW
jgi:hypothetical protein